MERIQEIYVKQKLFSVAAPGSTVAWRRAAGSHKVFSVFRIYFVRQVYWHRYTSGHDAISNDDARDFVIKAIQQEKTVKPWSENMTERVAGYLTRCCADFGMLEPGIKRVRKIISYRIEPMVAAFLAYDLHFSGAGDNAIITHCDWKLFGMEREDVIDELKRLSFKGFFIIQTAGDVIRIGWNYKSWEELTGVIVKG